MKITFFSYIFQEFCLDWFAEFNEDSGSCECIDGYVDSVDGCTPWANGDDAAGQAIMNEILRRLRFIGPIGIFFVII